MTAALCRKRPSALISGQSPGPGHGPGPGPGPGPAASSRRDLVDQNPLVWMAEVNGLLVDLRDTPREVQVFAYKKGLIPYGPADQE
jgi:hypothetical protein